MGAGRRLVLLKSSLGLLSFLALTSFEEGFHLYLVLLAPPQLVHGIERHSLAIVHLEVDAGGEGARVPDLKRASLLLTKDDVAEIDLRVLNADKGLLAGALEWDLDLARL